MTAVREAVYLLAVVVLGVALIGVVILVAATVPASVFLALLVTFVGVAFVTHGRWWA